MKNMKLDLVRIFINFCSWTIHYGNLIFEGIINNLLPRKGKYNIIENDEIKLTIEKFIEKKDYILIKRKKYIFEYIISSEMKITFLNNNLILFKGIKIDETGLFEKGKLFEFPFKMEVKILDFTEEGIKGKIWFRRWKIWRRIIKLYIKWKRKN